MRFRGSNQRSKSSARRKLVLAALVAEDRAFQRECSNEANALHKCVKWPITDFDKVMSDPPGPPSNSANRRVTKTYERHIGTLRGNAVSFSSRSLAADDELNDHATEFPRRTPFVYGFISVSVEPCTLVHAALDRLIDLDRSPARPASGGVASGWAKQPSSVSELRTATFVDELQIDARERRT